MQGSATKPGCSTSSPPCKRLLFDRRYGWVLDDWTEPSQEALSGGRGMFCIVPLAKAFINKASESLNVVTTTTLKVLERPDLLSPKVVHATLSDHMHQFTSSAKETGLVLMARNRNFLNESTSCSTDLPEEKSGSSIE